MPRRRKPEGVAITNEHGLVEGRDYTTHYLRDGIRQTTIPLPLPGCDPAAPWGYSEAGLVVAPFGIGKNGLPRRRMPPGPKGGGSAVRTSIALSIEEKLAGLNCDPIEVLAGIATDPEVDAGVRVRAASELANYLYPKRRAVRHDGEVTQKHLFVVALPADGGEPPTTATWLDSLPVPHDAGT